MRKSYLLLATFLLPVIAVAQQSTVSDIQGWILSHLGGTWAARSLDQQGRPVTSTSVVTLSFTNCNVSMNQDMSITMTYDAISPQREVVLTTHDHYISNFSLANAEPGKVAVVQAPSRPGYTGPHAWISMELRAPISVYSTTEVGTLGGFVRPDVSRAFQTNGVMINFSDLALAQRQANAWRDLITACGGKDISDKLY